MSDSAQHMGYPVRLKLISDIFVAFFANYYIMISVEEISPQERGSAGV